MKKLKQFINTCRRRILKFMVARYGLRFKKLQHAAHWKFKYSNRDLWFTASAKQILRDHHKITQNKAAEMHILPNCSLTHQLVFTCITYGWAQDYCTYNLVGTNYNINFCQDAVLDFFTEIPKNISYDIKILKQK